MAVLEKIRVRMGVFISVVIGLALLSFIIDPSTLQSAISMFSSKYDVGKMNGKAITYQDFQQKTDYYTQIQQLITGTSSLDDRASEMVQQRVWQDYMDDLVLFPAFKKAGISLGEEELFDLTQGREISPVLQQEPIFMDENGVFSRAKLVQFIQSVGADQSGAAAQYWQYLETSMEQMQMYIKYFSLLTKSTVLNTIELRRDMEENNITSDVRFIMQPMSFSADTTIKISAQEIKEYYEKHKSAYEQVAGRDMEYVQFSVVPSVADLDRAETDARKFYEEFSTTANLRQFLARNSDRTFDPVYYKAGELASISPVLDSFAFKANMTDVLPLTQEGDRFFSARLASVKSLPDSVFVQHILLSQDNAARADSLVDVLKKGGNFEELASTYSLIPANAEAKAGELGWMTAQMYGGALDTCLSANVNQPFSYASQFGLHVFRVTQKTKLQKKVQLAVYEKVAVAGKETFQTYYSQANELVSKSDNKEALFTKTAMENNWPVLPAYGVTEDARTVANISNARELVRWAFGAKKGEVSPVISIDNKYFIVATVVGVHEKGIAPLAEKRAQIEIELRRNKQMAKLGETLKAQMDGVSDIETLGEKLGVVVSKQTGIAFGAFGVQQLDPKFIGAVAGSPEHKLAGPIEGSIGAYIFTVDERQTGSFYTEEDAKQRHQQITAQQNQMAIYALSKAANVEDSRSKFF